MVSKHDFENHNSRYRNAASIKAHYTFKLNFKFKFYSVRDKHENKNTTLKRDKNNNNYYQYKHKKYITKKLHNQF